MKALFHSRSGRAPETLTPSAQKQRPPRIPKENVDPGPNAVAAAAAAPESSPFRSPSPGGAKPLAPKNRSPLPPRPPQGSSNRLKRKLSLETLPENGVPNTLASDSGVHVIVRIRPPNVEEEEEEIDLIVQKTSPNSVSILDHTFTFDSVTDVGSTQEDLFQLVGIPLVENCLSGFNSSIFAYGQTGSGKTYTMWGPPSALSEGSSLSSERGLTPRVFELLFSRIEEEQAKHSDKQLFYHCSCSFLEIYNEQITDLLDPTQRNLQIREDTKVGVYVDNLTEENVCTMKDVTQLLIKGLANRRTGATSVNAESSRSHCVFTCIVKSQYKNTTDGFNSLRISRINLVDLAGSERQKLTGAAGERLREAGNINRSLSQLGNLINILAEVSQSGKQRHIPYRDSKLTFLLQESLGGNAKLAMICAISPSQSCKSESFSTLRFAQRAKAIKNKAVVNEITQDDVNVLREQIRQLKDELLRMKSNGTVAAENGSYSTGRNARRSLNLLRMSLCRATGLPPTNKDDSDEEMEIDENDVEKPFLQLSVQPSCCEEETPSKSENLKEGNSSPSCKEAVGDSELEGATKALRRSAQNEHEFTDEEKVPKVSLSLEGKGCEFQDMSLERDCAHDMVVDPSNESSLSPSSITPPSSNLSIVLCQTSPVLQPPTLSISPVFENYSRKSLRTSSAISASQNKIPEIAKFSNNSPIRKSKNFRSSTEHLAASLHRGLEAIEFHQSSSVLRRSSFKFPVQSVQKVDVGIQTLDCELEMPENLPLATCSCSTNEASSDEHKDIGNCVDLQLVPVEGPVSSDKPKQQVIKAVAKVLTGAIRREMALEKHCEKQASEISQLHRLVQQYKHERECNAIIAETREDKIPRMESLMDGILSTEEFMHEEFISLTNEHKLLKEKYENHPEVLQLKIELKGVQEELDRYKNFFDLGEKDVLIEEIQDLRDQLQYYVNSSSISNQRTKPVLQLTHFDEPISSPLTTIPESNEESIEIAKLEEERRQWTEAESKWITLTEELRVELEKTRSLYEICKVELESEKKCSEELKEALQTAMQGHARILEQYADLQEKHMDLLNRHRNISDGIEDVKRAAAKAGVKGAESRFINSLAAEISVLRAEREKERRYWRDENKGLQAQLRDTAEAVQAAGELLVRLKEAEEAAAVAQKRALLAEREAKKAHEEIDKLKKNYDREIALLNQFLAESRLPRDAVRPTEANDSTAAKYDEGGSLTDQRWREEFEPFYRGMDNNDFSKGSDPRSWFSGYDRCNI